VRPVEQVAVPVGRDAEQATDQPDRVRLREVAEQLEATAGEQLARKRGARPAQRLDRPRRERGCDQLPDARVLRRLEPEQAPALGVPERLPTRVERLSGGEVVFPADVPEVAAEPPVA